MIITRGEANVCTNNSKQEYEVLHFANALVEDCIVSKSKGVWKREEGRN